MCLFFNCLYPFLCPSSECLLRFLLSFACWSRNTAIMRAIRDWVMYEWAHQHPHLAAENPLWEKQFTNDNIPALKVDVPQQDNDYDCGVFLLQFAELFTRENIIDVRPEVIHRKNWLVELKNVFCLFFRCLCLCLCVCLDAVSPLLFRMFVLAHFIFFFLICISPFSLLLRRHISLLL